MFKFNGDYQDLTQVYPFFADFKKEYQKLKTAGQYPYNSSFKGKIAGIQGADEDTAIYLLQGLQKEEEQRIYEAEMLAKGWTKLTEAVVQEALDKKKNIQLSAKATNDWATLKIDKVLKPRCFKGQYGLMELRAKTRGYALSQFEDAFCKIV